MEVIMKNYKSNKSMNVRTEIMKVIIKIYKDTTGMNVTVKNYESNRKWMNEWMCKGGP
jgi:hypothetical protein